MTREYQPDFFDEGPDGIEVQAFVAAAVAADTDVSLTVRLPAGIVRLLALRGYVLEDGGYTPEAHGLVLGETSEQDATVQAKASAWLRDSLSKVHARHLGEMTRSPEMVSLIEDERVRNGAKPYEDDIPW